jgi:hypothetical protein
MQPKKSTPTDPWASLFEKAVTKREVVTDREDAKTGEELDRIWGVGKNRGKELRQQLVTDGLLVMCEERVFLNGRLKRRVRYHPADENEGKKLAG